MKLPELTEPQAYAGLYVFDFGDQVAVGYTAEEIAVLLETERYGQGKVYRIHRAMPDGTMELAGVARERFLMEDGLFFYRTDETAWTDDYETLIARAQATPPPCRVSVQRARIEDAAHPLATAMIFPAEYTHDVAAWLDEIGYNGGELVEGGPSQVTSYREGAVAVAERHQLWPRTHRARPAEEVLATTNQAIQRRPA